MAIPSKFGDYSKSQLPTINFLGTTSTSSSKTNWGEVAGGIAGYGLGIFAEVMAAKKASGGGEVKKTGTESSSKEQSVASTPEGQLALAKGQKEALEDQIKSFSDTMDELAPKIDETQIQQKEANVNAMKEKLFGEKAKDKELVQQIQNCAARINTATVNLNTAKANVASLSSEISSLTTEKSNVDALAKEEGPDQTSAKARSAELQAQIEAKEQQKATEEQNVKNAEEQLEFAKAEETRLKNEQGEKYTQIQLDLETYNKESAEVKELRSAFQTNKTNYDTAANQKAKLEADLAKLESEIKSYENKLLEEKGEKIKQKQTLGEQYTEADKNDGNWWKRNMPSWLGGASKDERKEMKEEHDKKDAIVDAMEGLGGSKSDLKAIQETSISKDTDEFLSGKLTNSDIREVVSDAIKNGQDPTAAYNKEVNKLIEQKTDSFLDKAIKMVEQSKDYSENKKIGIIKYYNSCRDKIEAAYKNNIGISDQEILGLIQSNN